MESGNEESKSLIDLIRPYQEEVNRRWIEIQYRISLGIPEVYHTDKEGNIRLLSIEESLEFLDKNSIDLEDKDGE